jgi:hypothetical protein
VRRQPNRWTAARIAAVARVLQVLHELADPGLAERVDADQADRPRVHLAVALVLVLQQGGGLDDRGDGLDLGADQLLHLADLALVIGEAVERFRLDRDMGLQAAQPFLQLGGEPAHDAVDDDQRRHAEHDADDARQGQVTRPEVTPGEQQLVHGRLLAIDKVTR